MNVPPLRSQNQPPEPPVIERKDLIIKMHNDIYLLRQIRLALTDIEFSFQCSQPRRAEYQVYLLRSMIDEQPSRRKPWSTYQQLVLEEFDEEPVTYTEVDRSFDSSAGMGE